MKSILKFQLIFLSVIFLFGCVKDEEPNKIGLSFLTDAVSEIYCYLGEPEDEKKVLFFSVYYDYSTDSNNSSGMVVFNDGSVYIYDYTDIENSLKWEEMLSKFNNCSGLIYVNTLPEKEIRYLTGATRCNFNKSEIVEIETADTYSDVVVPDFGIYAINDDVYIELGGYGSTDSKNKNKALNDVYLKLKNIYRDSGIVDIMNEKYYSN